MADYISREQAIKAISEDIMGGLNYERILRELPAADVRENVHGEWIRHDEIKNVYGGIYIECPKCGEKYVVQYMEDEKFCRNCGADNRRTE